ncbi:hypothetical protein JZU54_05055 [bacterium]|nr:hypothetical protein [bacterium]
MPPTARIASWEEEEEEEEDGIITYGADDQKMIKARPAQMQRQKPIR